MGDNTLSREQVQSEQAIPSPEGRDFSGSDLAGKALQSLTIPVYLIDVRNLLIVYANDAAQKEGIMPGAACYTQSHQRTTPCGDEYSCPLEIAKATKAPASDRHRNYDADGNIKVLDIHYFPVLDGSGQVSHVAEFGFDITDRCQAQWVQNRSQRYLQNIIDYISDPVFVKDEQHRLLLINNAFCTLVGRPSEELVGKADHELYPQDQVRVFEEHDDRVFASMLVDENEETIAGAYGKTYTVSTKKAAFVDPVSGEKVLVGVIRDVTGHKFAEEAVRESEERFRTLYESSRDAIMQALPEEGFLAGNPAAVALFGCRDEAEFKTCSPADLSPEFQPDGSESVVKSQSMMMLALEKGSHFFEWTHKRFDGSVFPATVLLTRMTIGGKTLLQATVRDETERKRAEQALRESEERFRTIIDSARDAIVVMGPQGEIGLWSPGAEAIFGWTAEEAIGKQVHRFIVPVDHCDAHDKAYPAFQATGQGAAVGKTLELPALHKDGHEFPVELSLSAIKRNGRWHAVGILRDITERKRMENEIAYRLKIEEAIASASRLVQSPTPARMDELLRILGQAISVNRAYIFRSVEHRPTMNCVHEWCDSGTSRQINNLQNLDDTAFPWSHEILLRGEPVVVSHIDDIPPEAARQQALFRSVKTEALLLVPIVSAAKKLTGFIGFDHTGGRRQWHPENVRALQVVGEMIGISWDRQLAEETLRRTVDQFTAMINTVPALMYIKDAGNRYTVVNEAFCHAAKKGGNEIVGHIDSELFPPESADWLYGTGKVVMDSGRAVINQEKHVDLGDGVIRWLAATVVPLSDDSGVTSGTVGMVQDVTEGHLNREQLIQTDKLAAIGTLAAGVAHEINNPMGFISSNLNTMSKYLKKIETFVAGSLDDQKAERKKISEMFADFADAIAESLEGANRVKKIVADLKSFSRVDRAEKETANLNEGLESTLNIVWNELKYNCTVEKNYGDIPDLYCIPNQLNQVFLNLLVNAGQAITNPPGKILITTRADDENIYISIKDTGCGIPEENIAKIFEPFFTTKEVGKGTGLGLGLAYEIVKKHGGQITVTSKVGVGTEFVISLPQEGYRG
ncbi:MAG: PAS domain S-box protein [candidate division Zixibacteria bacterium]|nr:PAS domain S-box protein [candidate division Zixibacteria bacterium]